MNAPNSPRNGLHARATHQWSLNVRYKIVCLIYMYVFPFTGTILLFTGTGITYWGPGKNSSYLGVVNVNLNGTGVV